MTSSAHSSNTSHHQPHHHQHRSNRNFSMRTQPVEGLFCQYSHRVCMQNKIDGYDFCIKHILEDPSAPYRQCNYISNKTGKRCINAAARHERKDGYCSEHARRTVMLRLKASRKRKPTETPHSITEELAITHNKVNASSMLSGSQEIRRSRSLESLASRILGSRHDYASSSDSETEGGLVDQYWAGDNDSDAESVDSEQEDPLKHAGVYTAEEVALLTRDKLIRLQSLYIDQFKRLQYLLKEKRRKYLHNIRIDREQYGSIGSARDDPEQKDAYDKLQALKRYHKRYGKEALLHRQSQERRKQVSEGVNYRPPSYPKCISYVKELGAKCGERTIPLSKYCPKHILQDQFQVLFRTCHYKKEGENSCQQAVVALQDEDSRCPLHLPMHAFEHRMPKRQTSDDSTQSSKEGDNTNDQQVDGTTLSTHNIPLFVQGQNSKATSSKKSEVMDTT